MMQEELFLRFIANILNIRICSIAKDKDSLLQFEKECCFEKTLQPMYTAKNLEYLMQHTQPETFYEITDYLNTNVLFFEFEEKHYLLGPYVKSSFSPLAIQELLATHKLPARIIQSLELYYDQFPQISFLMVRGTILAAMRTFYPNTPEYHYRKLSGFHEELKPQKLLEESSRTYESIIERYDMENYFLNKITEGDVEGVRLAYEHTTSSYYANTSLSQRMLYSTDWSGFAVLRTLARKAAEQGGASVVKIDEITQKSIQRFSSAKSNADILNIQIELLTNLTQAVADSKKLRVYSPSIRKILSYLEQNYAQPYSLREFAAQMQVSEEHLSRRFHKEVGTSLTSYISDLRTKKAAELLKTTQLSISDIAMYVGYTDNNYFVKVFKKRYGMTPSAFRTLN